MGKFSLLSIPDRAIIRTVITEMREKADRYAEKCAARQMYNSVSPVLIKVANRIHEAMVVDDFTESIYMYIVGNYTGTDDGFADRLWASLGKHPLQTNV